jgi:hypothetical protein
MYWLRKVIIFEQSLKVFLFKFRNVTTGTTGTNAVAPKLSDTLTIFQPGGQILPTIAEVEPKISK